MPEQPGFKVLSNLGLKQEAIRLKEERDKREIELDGRKEEGSHHNKH